MSDIFQILISSFQMLLKRPVLFVPRLFSSVLSSILLILLILRKIDLLAFFVLFPIIALLGAFTPVIVSSMVEKENREKLLRKGLRESLGLWKQVLGLAAITIAIGFISSLPLSAGLFATILTGNPFYVFLGLVVSLLLILAASFGLYFVPISLVEEKKLSTGVKTALNTSSENRGEVISLTLFSFAILLLASMTTGILREIGLTVFLIGRITSSIVGTYILVISPKYYLEEGK